MRKTIQRTTIAVLHTVIRATEARRPGRIASSRPKKPRREVPGLVISTPAVMAYHHGGRSADANQIVRWIVEEHAHGETLGHDHPFKRLFHRRKARGTRISRFHAPAHSVDTPFERPIVVG